MNVNFISFWRQMREFQIVEDFVQGFLLVGGVLMFVAAILGVIGVGVVMIALSQYMLHHGYVVLWWSMAVSCVLILINLAGRLMR